MVEGTLIAESLRMGAEFSGVPLAVRKIVRAAVGDVVAGQPELWTLIEFEAQESAAGTLADAFASVLERGDAAGRAEAASYGRSVGVPEDQLDWPI